MHSSDPDAAPINPLPAAVIVLALPMVLVELALLAGAEGLVGGPAAVGWRIGILERWAFVPALFDWMVETGRWGVPDLARFVTYPFVHLGFLHMVMVLVFLMALGKLVGEVMGNAAVFAMFFVSAIAGALVLGLVTESPRPLAGGYPAVYGLIGGYTFVLRARLIAEGGPQTRAFSLIGMLLFIQLVFGALFGTGPDWIAEIAGFAAGFGLSFLIVPGGWARVLGWLRNR